MHPAHYRNAANISLQKLPPELQDLLSAQYVPSKIIRALDIIRQHRFASTGSDKMLVFVSTQNCRNSRIKALTVMFDQSWFKGTVRLMSESLRAEGIDHVTCTSYMLQSVLTRLIVNAQSTEILRIRAVHYRGSGQIPTAV